MNKKYFSTPHADQSKWYTSLGLVIILFIASFLAWFAIVAKASLDSEIKPTQLILKSEGCNFLKMNGVATKDAGIGTGCAVMVPFRQNMFGSGGLITLGSKRIRIADDQVVVIGAVEDQPWTPELTHTAIWMGVSTLIMVGIIVWVFILIL